MVATTMDSEAVALVMHTFDLNTEEFIAGINKNNKYIDERIKRHLNTEGCDYFGYLLCLADADRYGMFGADKAGLKDGYTLKEFFDAINVDIEDYKIELVKFHECRNKVPMVGMMPFTLFSRDKKITLAMSSSKGIEEGYFHYFGLTGEISAVLLAFKAYDKYCTDEGRCWNSRDYM